LGTNDLTAENIFVNDDVFVRDNLKTGGSLNVNESAVIGGGTTGGILAINYPLPVPASSYALNVKADTSSSGYVWKYTEYSGSEYMAGRLDSSGDYNIYADSGAIRMSILDASSRVGIGLTNPGGTLSVNGGCSIGSSYDSTVSPSNGCIIEGLVGIGTNSPYAYVDSQSIALHMTATQDTDYTATNREYTIPVTVEDDNITISLPKCSFKGNEDIMWKVKLSKNESAYQTGRVIVKSALATMDEGLGNFTLDTPGETATFQCDAIGDYTVIENSNHFAFLEAYNYTSDGYNQTITQAGVYENVTGLLMDDFSGFTVYDENYFIVHRQGTYKLDFSISFSSDSPNENYGMGIQLNGDINNDRGCYGRRFVSSAGDVGNAGGTCIMKLDTGDMLNFVLENEDGSADATIYHIAMNAVRIKKYDGRY